MKKTNLIHLLIMVLSLGMVFGLDFYLNTQDLNLNVFDLELNEVASYSVIGILYILHAIIIYYVTRLVFKLYIKHERDIKFNLGRGLLLISSLLVWYSFFIFDLKYYSILSLLLSVILYFGFLYLQDINYVRESQKSHINVNDEVVDRLLVLLGGRENIEDISYVQSRLKVNLVDVKKADLAKIKDLGATGLFVAGNKLQAFVGSSAMQLEEAIKKYLSRS